MTLAVLHGIIPIEMARIALDGNFLLPAPLAPGEGLLLAGLSFWDQRREKFHLITTDVVRGCAERIKRELIYPEIARLLGDGGLGSLIEEFISGMPSRIEVGVFVLRASDGILLLSCLSECR